MHSKITSCIKAEWLSSPFHIYLKALSIHTFLKIATAATGIILTTNVSYKLIFVLVMYECTYIYGSWHTKSRFKIISFYCNNLSHPTSLSNYEILHYDFSTFFKWSWLNLRFPLWVAFPHAVQDLYIIVIYPAGICLLKSMMEAWEQNVGCAWGW